MLQPDVIEVFQRAGISYKEPLGVVLAFRLKRSDSVKRSGAQASESAWNTSKEQLKFNK